MIVVKIDEFKLLCFVEVEEDMAQHLLIEAVAIPQSVLPMLPVYCVSIDSRDELAQNSLHHVFARRLLAIFPAVAPYIASLPPKVSPLN